MSRSQLIEKLQRINGWRLWTAIYIVTVMSAGLIVLVLDMFLTGRDVMQDLIITFIATTIIEPTHLLFMIFLLGEFSKREKLALEKIAHYAQDHLHIALNNSQMIIWELDPVKGELRYDYDMLKLFGMAADEAAPRTLADWTQRVHPDDRAIFSERFNALAQSGEVAVDFEYRLQFSSGKTCWVRTQCKVAKRDFVGNPMWIIGSTMNVNVRKQADLAKLEAHKRAELIFNGTPDAMVISRLSDGIITEVNEAFIQASGYARTEAIGNTTNGLQAWAHKEQRMAMLELLKRDGCCRELEAEFVTKSGKLFTGAISAVVTELDGVPQIISTIRDVSERKRMQVAMQESETLFHSIFSQANEGILLIDPETQSFDQFNDAVCKGLGYEREEFAGLTLADIQGEMDAAAIAAHLRGLLASASGSATFETVHRRKDGELRAVKVSCKAINLKGRQFVFSTSEDITERKRDEAALQASEQKMLAILDNVEAYIYLKDTEGRYLFANRMVRELWHATMEEVVGYEDEKFFDAQTSGLIKSNDRRVLQHGESLSVEETNLVQATGQRATYWSRKIPLRHEDGRIYALCGISTDITERKKIEESVKQAEYMMRESQRVANIGSYSTDFVAGRWTASETLNHIFGIDENYDKTIQGWLDLVHPDDVEMMDMYLKNLITKKIGQFDKEYRIVRRSDSETRWVWGMGKMTFDADGKAISLLGTIQDIHARKQSEQIEKKLTRTITLLSRCDSALVRANDEHELLHHICQLVVEVGGYLMAWAGYAQDDEAKSVLPVARSGYEEGYLEKANISWADVLTGRGATGTAIRTGQTVCVQDFLNSPAYLPWRDAAAQRGYNACIALPLRVAGRVIGTLNIYAADPYAFNRDEQLLLEDLSNDLAYGVQTLRWRAEKEAAQRALKRESEKNLTLLHNASDGIHILNQNGDVIEASDSFCAMLGYTRDEVIGMNVALWDAHFSREELREALNKQFVGQLPSLFETRHKRKDGTIFDVEVSGYPLVLDGKPALFNSSRDITERKLNQAQMRIAATAFESHEGMIVTDEQCNILRVNRAFTEITGFSADEVIGKNPRILSAGRQDADFYRRMWRDINQRGSWAGELWNRRKNGEIYQEHLAITAVQDEHGKVTNYVGAQVDSTQHNQTMEMLRNTALELQKANAQVEEERARLAIRVNERTAELQRANHAKDSFLATMSHEIRTPLGGLLGMMELLGLSKLDERQKETLNVARNSGVSLLRIVDDILDWSKIEAGKLQLAPKPTSLADVLKRVVNTYAQLAYAKDIILQQHLDARLASLHLVDPLRLAQILNNFTSNAIKFTEQGSVAIEAILISRHDGYDRVRFSVKDSGVGIDQQQMSRLFRHYEQASADTARMYGGTGLGLSICRRLADLMGGEVGVDSTPRKGSTFSLTLDLPVVAALDGHQEIAAELPASSDAHSVQPLAEPGRHIAVLIVDDHPVNRMLLKQQLELLGLQVDAAADGKEALALLRDHHFDLLITDCHMPEMDGYELTQCIRDGEKNTGRHVPVIAWTANVLADEAERCYASGMDDIMHKPTDMDTLRAKLLFWLRREHLLMPSEASGTSSPVRQSVAARVALNLHSLAKIAPRHPTQSTLLREFGKQIRLDVAKLESALHEKDYEEIKQTVARLKGTSRMMGAEELEDICARIEKAAMQNDMAGARGITEQVLGSALDRLALAISQHVGREEK